MGSLHHSRAMPCQGALMMVAATSRISVQLESLTGKAVAILET